MRIDLIPLAGIVGAAVAFGVSIGVWWGGVLADREHAELERLRVAAENDRARRLERGTSASGQPTTVRGTFIR